MVVGFVALACFLFLAADALQIDGIWVVVFLVAILLIWGLVVLYRKQRTKTASQNFSSMLEGQAEKALFTPTQYPA